MANFRTPDDVKAWVDEHGIDELRNAVISPTRLHPANRSTAIEWLGEQERLGAIAREDEVHDFMRRQTVAAEDSAASARESAKAARDSVRWAAIGAFISLAMLVATAWPYFKLIDALQRFLK